MCRFRGYLVMFQGPFNCHFRVFESRLRGYYILQQLKFDLPRNLLVTSHPVNEWYPSRQFHLSGRLCCAFDIEISLFLSPEPVRN